MQGIYLITNKLDGKVYVGQSMDIEHRWSQHRHDAFNQNNSSYNGRLYRAIRKYGLNNFTFIVLETVEDSSQLTDREIHYFNVYEPEYNIAFPTRGNSFATRTRPVVQLDKNGNLVGEFVSMADAYRRTGIDDAQINISCRSKNKGAGGYIWLYREDYEKQDYNINAYPKLGATAKRKVAQYTKDMILLNTFDSLGEATRQTGTPYQAIIAVCKGRNKSSNGYIWKYVR